MHLLSEDEFINRLPAEMSCDLVQLEFLENALTGGIGIKQDSQLKEMVSGTISLRKNSDLGEKHREAIQHVSRLITDYRKELYSFDWLKALTQIASVTTFEAQAIRCCTGSQNLYRIVGVGCNGMPNTSVGCETRVILEVGPYMAPLPLRVRRFTIRQFLDFIVREHQDRLR